MNFLHSNGFLPEEKNTESSGGDPLQEGDTGVSSECGGEWKHPRNCNPDNYTCEYSVRWRVHKKDEIFFSITSNHVNLWTGIAFSDDEKMVMVQNLRYLK